jgi:hypothetical protein
MNENYDDKHFFELRKEGKTYISKAFSFPGRTDEIRNVYIAFENSNLILTGEVDGALSLRQSPSGKQQVLALVSQDDKSIKSLTFQKFNERKSGDYIGIEKDSFTFRSDEFQRLLAFLKSLQFIDFSNKENHQIEDLSSNTGNKTIIDSSEKALVKILDSVHGEERTRILTNIKDTLTKEDFEILMGRKEALTVFKEHITKSDWTEPEWQAFFETQSWIFGFGLDYRFMNQFDREMNVSSVGSDNKEKAIVDFLMTFNDFTVTVEIKRPDTLIFEKAKGRSGIWNFHHGFVEAISQVLEQKTEWHILGQKNNLYNKQGTEKLSKRTRDAKAILIIGNKSEFDSLENIREREIKMDTFELFRRDSRNVDIFTYDELYERANFIVNYKKV